MAFTRMLRNLIRDPDLGPRIVPIIPDEARTFGMDPLFNEVGIYSAIGQRYEPVDSELVLKYREAIDGQVLEEGITEAGSAAGFQAAGTSYATHGYPVIPFYIFYSMFGFQRTGDQLWAAGDARARGFLMAATAGRTTLTGEGLQHDDGHSHVLAMTNPATRRLRPDVRLRARRDHPRRHRADAHQGRGPHLLHLDLQRELRPGAQARGRRRGDPPRHLPLRRRRRRSGGKNGSNGGSAARSASWARARSCIQVIAAQALLAEQFGVAAEVYSAPSFPMLRRDALQVDRWNRLHPAEKQRVPVRRDRARRRRAARSSPPRDWMKALPDLVRPWIEAPFVTLGTDGFGRSDTRDACAPTSRSTRRTSPRRPWRRSPRPATSRREAAAKAHRGARRRPGQGRPARHLARRTQVAVRKGRGRSARGRDHPADRAVEGHEVQLAVGVLAERGDAAARRCRPRPAPTSSRRSRIDREDLAGAVVGEQVGADEDRVRRRRGRRSRRSPCSPGRGRTRSRAGSGRPRGSTSSARKQCAPSIRFQPKFRPPWPARATSTSSQAPCPTSPIQRSPVARSKRHRHGLRSPTSQISSAPSPSGERVVRRDAVGAVAAVDVDVDPEDLAEQRVEALAVACGSPPLPPSPSATYR